MDVEWRRFTEIAPKTGVPLLLSNNGRTVEGWTDENQIIEGEYTYYSYCVSGKYK